MILSYIALALLAFIAVVLAYGLIAIHDRPYQLAKARDHPHQDAIEAAGWVSLFTLHAIWPLLWIWAMMYRPERGWGIGPGTRESLETRIAELEKQVFRSKESEK